MDKLQDMPLHGIEHPIKSAFVEYQWALLTLVSEDDKQSIHSPASKRLYTDTIKNLIPRYPDLKEKIEKNIHIL